MYDQLTVFWAIVLFTIYFPAVILALRRLRRRTSLREFSYALAAIIQAEVLNGNLDAAITRIDSVFSLSPLNRSYPSSVGLIEHIHYLVSTNRTAALTDTWDGSMSAALQSLWREMESKQPFSSLSGESRRLLESVNVTIGSDNEAGTHALGVLADHIKITEKRLADQRLITLVFGGVSVVGVVLTIVGLVLTVLNFRLTP